MASLETRTATKELREVQEHIEVIQRMAHSVYNTLGCGYDEIIYKEALMVELRNAHISYERERYVPILYGPRVIGTGKADIVVIPTEGLSVPIECKKTLLKEDDRQQLRTYMKGMGNDCEHGILIRFPQPGTHKSEKIDPPEFYWARKDREGNVEFYRHADNAWIPDENKQERKLRRKTGGKTSAQESAG
jgi:GxxExxY protein